MQRCFPLRLLIPAILAATLLPASYAQSQDSESVAEAARRAREQKKTPAKPVKVITNDDVKPATPETVSVPGAAPAAAATASPNANASAAPASNSAAPGDAKDQKEPKEVSDLKEQIKQAMNDLDLVTRAKDLEQDNYLSKPDYANDTAGKAKIEALLQQITDKQQDLDKLKARLAELLPPQDNSSSNQTQTPSPTPPPPPKPQF
jgi:uncharacterized coiled-coil protein SlyX